MFFIPLDLSHANAFNLDKGKILSFSKELTLPAQRHLLMPLGNRPFENTVRKGEIACYEKFLLFPQCFLPVWITFCYFRQI